MRRARLLRAFCFSCLVLFFCPPLELHAQTESKEYVAGFIQSSIEIETDTWFQGKPISVTVKVKNISDRAVNLLGTYSFELTNVNDPDALKRGVPPTSYWSPVNILNGTPLKLQTESEWLKKGIVVGKVPEGALHLEPRETKVMKFELTQLLWNKSISSVWPYQKLFEVVPKGDYDLLFEIHTDRRMGADNHPLVTQVDSNKVKFKIE